MNIFSKIGELKLPARASLWYMMAAVIGKGVSFLATPFFTRLMSDEEYGIFTLYITILGICSVICSAVYSGSGVYRALQVYKDKSDAITKAFLVVTISFSLVVCTLLFAFSTFLGIKSYLLLPISIQLICDGIVGLYYSRAKFSYQYKSVCTLSIIGSVLPPVISAMALPFFSGAQTRIYSLLAVSLLISLYALLSLRGKGEKAETGLVKYSFRQALAVLPHTVSGALSGQADKLIITALSGSVALAKYSVAHSLGAATAFLGAAIGSALNPWIVRRLEQGKTTEISELLLPVFSFLCAFTLMPIIFAPEIISFLAPVQYSDALGAVLPIALSSLPAFLIATVTVGLVFLEKGGYTVTLSLICAISSILLSLVFTMVFGYFGAGLALLVSQGIGSIFGFVFLRICKLYEMFKVKKLAFEFIFTTLVGALALLCSDFLSIRVALLIVPSIMLLNLIFGYGRIIFEKKASHPV